jgi:lipopolysaccharide transport system ATP-binding protein
LAVGDAEFQKKCIGKMDSVSKNEGRTVVFVSHNLAAVSQLCNRGILLRQGNLILEDEVNAVIHEYISNNRTQSNTGQLINIDLRKGDRRFKVDEIKLLDYNLNPIRIGRTGSELIFQIIFDKKINPHAGSFRIDFAIDNEQDQRIAWFSSDAVNSELDNEFENLKLKINKFPFGAGTYYLTFYCTVNGQVVDYIHQGFAFTVEEGDFFGTGKTIPKSQTFIYTDHLVEI